MENITIWWVNPDTQEEEAVVLTAEELFGV